jgi:hypothetical protein
MTQTQLISREDFIVYCHREGFKSYTCVQGAWGHSAEQNVWIEERCSDYSMKKMHNRALKNITFY